MSAVTRSVDRLTFLSTLRESGILTEAQLRAVWDMMPEVTRGRLLARELVRLEILTRFQAERLLAGRTQGFLLNQYIILDELGAGGMGRVYKARHQTMDRIVALKILSPSLLETDRALELFAREIQAAAQLAHPNIVTAFDANNVNGRHYLVMEFIDGPNLDQLVKQQGPLSVGQACDFIRQAATGLQCAHLQGMVHRDIKPANILVQRRGLESEDAPGLVKISDFGLARLQDSHGTDKPSGTILTRPNTVMGTPDFLSPEQARSLHKTDIRSDIYSLGATFYFLLTGEVLFPGGASLEKLIRHSTETPKSVTEKRNDIPTKVDAIIQKMLSKHPDDRFQTPDEVVEALTPFSVRGPTPWEPPRPASDPLLESDLVPFVEEEASLEAEMVTIPGEEPSSTITRPTTPIVRTSAFQRTENQSQMKKALIISISIVSVIGLIALLISLLT